MTQTTVNSGGGSSTSMSYLVDGSVAQPATVGKATSGTYVLQSGFWTNLSAALVLRVRGDGSGSGSVGGDGIACDLTGGVHTGDCTQPIGHGESVELVASPDPMSQFDGWTGCDSTSTSSIADDTCHLTMFTARTATAGFTLLGSVGDFVWRDIDGDGVQDVGEPGLDGVSVTLDSGGVAETVMTSGGGYYVFLDVPPGTYDVRVDPLTLPAGLAPSFDADGAGTAHVATVTLSDGQERSGVDFGYQPMVDLSITKDDSADPLPGGQNLIYMITVTNAGPSYATDVVVTDVLPGGTTLVASSGCAEDPAGAPTCSLGTISAGDSAAYTLEVSIDPAPPASITNTATVSSAEADLNLADNSASQSTELDDDPLTITMVQVQPATADGVLAECETVNGHDIGALRVQFAEPALDPTGDGMPGDVTNPASWSLVFAGDDAEFSTDACGVPAGDDESVAIDSIAYDGGAQTATLFPESMPPGLYRLFACGTGPYALTDQAGNPLDGDGDGTAGGDFLRGFRADPDNVFANGHLDCGLGDWDASSAQISHSTDDLDGSADSGSAAVVNVSSSGAYELDQCLALSAETAYRMGVELRLDTDAPYVAAQLACSYFAGGACGGEQLGSLQSAVLLVGDTGGDWLALLYALFDTPTETVSARCGVRLTDPSGSAFDARLDQLMFTAGGLIFEDGFESGDTSEWSSAIP